MEIEMEKVSGKN